MFFFCCLSDNSCGEVNFFSSRLFSQSLFSLCFRARSLSPSDARARALCLNARCSPADGLGRGLGQRRRGPHEGQRRTSPGRGDMLDCAVAFRFRFFFELLVLLARALRRSSFWPRLGGRSRRAPCRCRGAGPRRNAGAGGGGKRERMNGKEKEKRASEGRGVVRKERQHTLPPTRLASRLTPTPLFKSTPKPTQTAHGASQKGPAPRRVHRGSSDEGRAGNDDGEEARLGPLGRRRAPWENPGGRCCSSGLRLGRCGGGRSRRGRGRDHRRGRPARRRRRPEAFDENHARRRREGRSVPPDQVGVQGLLLRPRREGGRQRRRGRGGAQAHEGDDREPAEQLRQLRARRRLPLRRVPL